ncbi:MAG: Heat shock protein Hsp20 family [Nitrospira sp.]|jgi:HSP20 family protein|nr:Heat shock protein Hsp20 family [Nitrospira sp.]
MAVMKWDPLHELERMADRLNRVISRPEGWSLSGNGQEAMAAPDWIPTVDISETEAEYAIHAELPGVKKEAVKVTMENGVLTIQGERTQEQTESGRKHHRIERTYGRFVRSFMLPDTVDAGKASAEYADGMLHLHLPKSEKAKPKQVEVKIA